MNYIKTLLFIFLLPISFAVRAQSVDVNTFEKGLSDSVQVVDVRTPEEFNQGHLKNARLANWKEKEGFMDSISALDKDKPLYIYCRSGTRSAAAVKLLKEKGFKKVVELKGGINAWKEANKPLEGETNKPLEGEKKVMLN